jgi:hypothetical protein
MPGRLIRDAAARCIGAVSMTKVCSLCGARYPDGNRCQERFDLALAKELEDPAYGVVHHLTVPAYLLQHNRYSAAGWGWSRALLAEFVRGGISPAEARRAYRRQLDSGNRDWSVTREPAFEHFDQIVWTTTIADVRFDSAEVFCADIRAWAEAVLAATDPVVART